MVKRSVGQKQLHPSYPTKKLGTGKYSNQFVDAINFALEKERRNQMDLNKSENIKDLDEKVKLMHGH